MDDEEDDLVEGFAQQEGEAGGDEGVAKSRLIGFHEPLQGDGDDHQGYAKIGDNWHRGVEEWGMTCRGIEPLGQDDVEGFHGLARQELGRFRKLHLVMLGLVVKEPSCRKLPPRPNVCSVPES